MEENYQTQRLEALEELYRYNKKLIPSIEAMITELRGESQEDTKELLDIIVEGINWDLSILNYTLDMFNKDGENISKDGVNSMVIELGEALKAQDNPKVANIFEGKLLPILQKMQELLVTIVDIKEN